MGFRGQSSPKPFSFTLAADTNYAPEILYFGLATSAGAAAGGGQLDAVDEIRTYITNLPASARLELDIWDPSANTWRTNVDAQTIAGLGSLLKLAGHQARLRGKAGGSAGSLTGFASWTLVTG